MSDTTPQPKSTNFAETRSRFQWLSTVWRVPLWLLKKLPVGGVWSLAIAAIVITSLGIGLEVLQSIPKYEPFVPTTEMALEALDNENWAASRALAAQIRQLPDLDDEQLGTSAYVLGRVTMRDAEDELELSERRIRFLLAARYFQEAEYREVPEQRKPDVYYSLGRSLTAADRWVEAIPALRRALEFNPQHKTELHRLLANALLRDPKGSMDDASKHIREFLGDPLISPRDRAQARLEYGQIRLKLGDFKGCSEVVAGIAKDHEEYAAGLVLLGRVHIAAGDDILMQAGPKPSETEAQRAAQAYENAQVSFSNAIVAAGSDSRIERQAQYLLGICLRKLGEYEAAEAQFLKTRRYFFAAPEGFASQLEEAELQILLTKYPEALKSYERLMAHIDDPLHFTNQWVSLDEFRHRVERAFRALRDAGRLEDANELTGYFEGLFADDFVVELRAEIRQVAAAKFAEEAKKAEWQAATELQAKARREYREAARYLSKLAQLRPGSQDYDNLLWKGAENYILGQDYRRAIPQLILFKNNQSRRNHAPVLLALAECELALNQPDQALEYAGECLQFFPRHPLSFRARILASQAKLELGKSDDAKRYLLEILDDENLTPRSIEWREALFSLGRILFYDGLELETKSRLGGADSDNPDIRRVALKGLEQAHDTFQDAIRRLGEAVQRFPVDGQSFEARYLLAEAQRHSAIFPRKRLTLTSIETTRVLLNRQINQLLGASVESHRELIEVLHLQEEDGGLSNVQQMILRNAHFARADALFDLGRYDEAIRAYTTATNRYQSEPEALDAFVQVASCHRRLNRLGEARGAIEQAKAVLERMRPDADFTKTTNHDRGQWQQMLEWLGNVYTS